MSDIMHLYNVILCWINLSQSDSVNSVSHDLKIQLCVKTTILFPIPSHYTSFFCTDKWPVSRVSWWACPMSHHVPSVTGMHTSLFWTVHCGTWVGCIVGFEGLFYSVRQYMDSYFWLSNTSRMYPYCLFPTMHAAHAIVYLLFVLAYCFMCLPIALKLYLFFFHTWSSKAAIKLEKC